MKTDTHIEGSISDEQIQDVDVFDRCSCFGEHRSRREQKGRIAWWVSLIFIIGMYHLCLELFDNYTSFSMIKFENGKRIVPELETCKCLFSMHCMTILLIWSDKNLTLFKPFPGKLFRDNETFKSATEDTKDLYWKGLFPREFHNDGKVLSRCDFIIGSGGIVSLSSEFVYQAGLPASSPNPNNDGEFVYNLGVFHQLHCLVSSNTCIAIMS